MTTFKPGDKVRIKKTGELGFVQRPVAFNDELYLRQLYGFYYLVNSADGPFKPGWECGQWCKPEDLEAVHDERNTTRETATCQRS